jgi:hypothetical protein
VSQLREALTAEGEDAALRRLFPVAYPDDPERDAGYRALVHDDLRAGRLAALDTMEGTLGDDRLDEDTVVAWMGVVNDLRLVLGTRLDVSEETELAPDPDDPRAGALAVYTYLGYVLETLVDALAGRLRPPGTGGGEGRYSDG